MAKNKSNWSVYVTTANTTKNAGGGTRQEAVDLAAKIASEGFCDSGKGEWVLPKNIERIRLIRDED